MRKGPVNCLGEEMDGGNEGDKADWGVGLRQVLRRRRPCYDLKRRMMMDCNSENKSRGLWASLVRLYVGIG